MELLINSEQALEAAIVQLRMQFKEKKYIKAKLSYGRQRTLTQNAALHKFCDNLAARLNEAGLDQRKVLKPSVDIPWTMQAVKDGLWRPVQEAVTGIKSTTKPEASQYSAIYEVLNRHLTQKLGIHEPWPCKESKENEQS
jgi:hypothetical protein